MFQRPTVRYGRTPEPETPYQRAGQVWDERIGSARVQARNWRLAFFGMLFFGGGLAAGLVWQSARGTVTPWVVQVDKLGQSQAVAPARRRLSADRSADRLASRALRPGGARHSGRSGRAAAELARRLQLRHRQGRAGAQRLCAHERSLLQGRQDAGLDRRLERHPRLDDSFRVAWTERRYVDDALAATERWSAILTIVVQPPTDADRLKKNPLGVYVHALNWSKELG